MKRAWRPAVTKSSLRLMTIPTGHRRFFLKKKL
jgi:hypothetical protein